MTVRAASACPACAVADRFGHSFARGGFAYARCAACGHLFVDPCPDAATIEALYTEDYWGAFIARLGHTRLVDRIADDRDWAAFALRRDVLPLAGRGRLLDVGASSGAYVVAARAAGFAAEGIEPSVEARALALEHNHVDLHPGTLESAALEGRFDVVVARDVVEHVPDPLRFVAAAVAVLAPGGIVVLETPTTSSPVFAWEGSRWFLADPDQHLQLFCEVSMSRLLARAGLTLRTVYSPNGENMVAVAERAASAGS